MSITRIYHHHQLSLGQEHRLTAAASHHLLHVMRCKLNDELAVFNGEQGEFHAVISAINKKTISVRLIKSVPRDSESPLNIELGQGLSRGERMDYAIQKATELGVASITPIITSRCNVKLNSQRLEKRVQHWQAIAISACEQSGRIKPPVINRPQPLEAWLSQSNNTGIVCVPNANTQSLPAGSSAPVRLLIGPEGGLSTDEAELATQKYKFSSLSLGPRILRTETATVAALTLLQYHCGDLG